MRRHTCLVGLSLALLLAGCGGKSYKTALVSGLVTLDGEPLPNATVMFIPVADGAGKDSLPSSIATTDPDGRYSLVLSIADKPNPGALLGNHKVSFTLGAPGSSNDTQPTFHQQRPQRYNRKTELECEVRVGGRDDANFRLKSR
jgi:hypothetical protein